MKIIAISPLSLIGMCLLLALTGCTLTVGADGSKSATVSGEQVLRAIEIYSTK